MGAVRKPVPLVLTLVLLLPAAAGAFTISLPADSVVTIGSPSRLLFRVTNTDATEDLSRIVLRLPAGYQVTGGSAPSGWTVEPTAGDGAQVSFKTVDETACTGAIAPGGSAVFSVAAIAPSSPTVTPDRLVAAQGEQSCRGVALDPPAALPSWDRLGLTATIAAAPPTVGVGGDVTVTMAVTNLSPAELADISALLSSAGSGSVSGLAGPSPRTLALPPGASGILTWTGRAASAGTLSFRGQAVAHHVASPPTASDTLFVGDLDVSLSVTPEQVASGQDVQVQMTVTNRGPVRVADVTPSGLTVDGTAAASAPSGPTPTNQPALEPGESAIFAWAATISGQAADTYAFSGWASAERGSIVSQSAASNRGRLGPQDVSSGAGTTEGSVALGGGVADGETAAAASVPPGTPTSGGTVFLGAAPAPTAMLQFISLNNDGGSSTGGAFSSTRVRDLRILVAWQTLSGAHSQRVELFAPDGSLYERFSAAFVNASSVETDLPVGGTWITEFSLFGTWRVEVFLDTGQTPITSGVFDLTP